MPASREDWERAGPMLAARRIQISARYANRRAFAEDTGLNWRTLYDAEYGRRATFKPETVRAFEVAYRLVPGSMERTLAGGDLEPMPAPARPERRVPRNPYAFSAAWADDEPEDDPAWDMFPNPADRLFRMIWRKPFPVEVREQKVGELRAAIRRALEPGDEESASLPAAESKDLATKT
jgi:hypothetical protein